MRRRKSQSVFTSINYYLIDRLISFHLTSSGRVAINPSIRITWSSSGSLCSLSKLPFLYSITFIFVLLPFIVSEPILYSNIYLSTCFHRYSIFSFICMFCRSLFVLLYFLRQTLLFICSNIPAAPIYGVYTCYLRQYLATIF